MVFCCDPFEPLSPEEEAAFQNHAAHMAAVASATQGSINTTNFTSVDDDDAEVGNSMSMNKDPYEQENILLETESDGQDSEILVSVTLPPGVTPGQRIEVRSPDGKRTVDTVVPEGLEVGQTFLVRFPPTHQAPPVSLPSIPAVKSKDVSARIEPAEAAEKIEQAASKEKPQKEKIPPSKERKKTLSEALESLLIPTPDPPVPKPGRENKKSHIDPPCPSPKRVNAQEAEQVVNKPKTLASTPLRRVEGSPVPDARVTPVETRQEGDENGYAVSKSETDGETETDTDFEAEAPPPPKPEMPGLSLVRSLEDFLTPKPDYPPPKKPEPQNMTEQQKKQYNQRLHQKIVERHHLSKKKDQKQNQREQSQSPKDQQSLQSTRGPQQKLLQVQVPPGMPPGSTIFVEIPGENRTVAAQVPPNVSIFHVAYTPQTPRPTPPPAPPPVPQQPMQQQTMHHQAMQQQGQARNPMPTPRNSNYQMPMNSHRPGREKLLSVKVPPGTPPGTTLHVSVPDEPGRILAAKVPPGNVTKFHVSYIPTEHHGPRSMLPPVSPYRGSASQQSFNTRDQGDFFGDTPYLPSMGTGGASAYSHYSHNYNQYPTGNDYGATTGGGWGDYGY